MVGVEIGLATNLEFAAAVGNKNQKERLTKKKKESRGVGEAELDERKHKFNQNQTASTYKMEAICLSYKAHFTKTDSILSRR